LLRLLTDKQESFVAFTEKQRAAQARVRVRVRVRGLI